MKTPPAKGRRWIVWLLLPTLVVTVLAWFDEPESDAQTSTGRHSARRPPAPADRPPSAAGGAPTTGTAPTAEELAERLELPGVVIAGNADPADATVPAAAPVDLLAARSWYVAPPPPPPEVPKAPPLPFKVLGRIIEGDAPAVFLSSQERNLIAREGVQLDNTYLVERIEKNRMTLIYLPLAERQYLTLGAVN